MFEPRGHDDMYGAILSADTELTESGEAHMGVLFTHNDGFSTMCGHATIAMGRFLVDTHEPTIFPKRKELKYDGKTKTIDLVLHAPCGPLQVTVPTTEDGWRSDPTRPVSFVSVPSFATAIDLSVCIEEKYRWPELGDRKSIAVDLAYGGAFYCVLPAASLGFPDGSKKPNLDKMSFATKQLKAAINDQSEIRYFLRHPEHRGSNTSTASSSQTLWALYKRAQRVQEADLLTSPTRRLIVRPLEVACKPASRFRTPERS